MILDLSSCFKDGRSKLTGPTDYHEAGFLDCKFLLILLYAALLPVIHCPCKAFPLRHNLVTGFYRQQHLSAPERGFKGG